LSRSREVLCSGKSVVIDSTNGKRENRLCLIRGSSIRCILFTMDISRAMELNIKRNLETKKVPKIAFISLEKLI
jgi:predicted kinase